MRGEARAVTSLAVIMAFRMLGLFMILPIFAVAVQHMSGATPRLIGLALGCYGLTQACLQIPFGMASDRIGRKPIITVGLIVFALGSVVAARADNIYWIIFGRALQGAGAIGSTVLALVADLTPDETRTRAMAIMGMCIGLSFALAMVLGPFFNVHYGLSGIFWFTAIMAVVGLLLLWTVVPTAPRLIVHSDVEPLPHRLRKAIRHPQLLRLDFSIFALHASLTMMFIVLPHQLHQQLHLQGHSLTIFYLIVLAVSFVLMTPWVIFAEKKRKLRGVMIGAVLVLGGSQIGLAHAATEWRIGLWLTLFFTAFTFMESCLPSLISKVSSLRSKGAAMGVYSTSQFAGIFVGGLLGGLMWSHFGVTAVWWMGIGLSALWFFVLYTMLPPPYSSTVMLSCPEITGSDQPKLEQKALSIPGVFDALWCAQEKLLMLKVDRQQISKEELHNQLKGGSL